MPGSVTYTVERTQGGAVHAIASGLTLPNFTDAPTENGTVEYSVKAVNSNGTQRTIFCRLSNYYPSPGRADGDASLALHWPEQCPLNSCGQ